jgi:hypothetical protein
MDKCSEAKKTRQSPFEWIKCVEYSSGYAPLEGEGTYLNSFIEFNSEVRRRLVRAACTEDPIVHYRTEGFKDPNFYLFGEMPLIVHDSLQVERLRKAGVKQDYLRIAAWNWSKFLGASETLNKAIKFSGHRYDGEAEDFALNEYLEQLRQVVYRNGFKAGISSKCPEKLGDFNKPVDLKGERINKTIKT